MHTRRCSSSMRMKPEGGMSATRQLVQGSQDIHIARGTRGAPCQACGRACRSFVLSSLQLTWCGKPLCVYARMAENGNTHLHPRRQMQGFTTRHLASSLADQGCVRGILV